MGPRELGAGVIGVLTASVTFQTLDPDHARLHSVFAVALGIRNTKTEVSELRVFRCSHDLAAEQ
jgi:hypothetical protein